MRQFSYKLDETGLKINYKLVQGINSKRKHIFSPGIILEL